MMLRQPFVNSDWLTPDIVRLTFHKYNSEVIMKLRQHGHLSWATYDPNCAYLWLHNFENKADCMDYLVFVNEEEDSADISV